MAERALARSSSACERSLPSDRNQSFSPSQRSVHESSRARSASSFVSASSGAALRASRSAAIRQKCRLHGGEIEQQLCDLTGTRDEVADEALQVVDEARLEAHHRRDFRPLQLDGAREPGHERFGVVREAREDVHEIPKRAVDFGGVGRRLAHELANGDQPRANVVEGDGLQLGASRERFTECLKTSLDRFAADGHSVEQALAVEVFDGGDALGVGLSLQVSPLDELAQRVLNGFERRRSIGPARFGEHIVGAEVKAELAFGGGEDVQDRAVLRAVLRYHVAEEERGGGVQGGGGHPRARIGS